ncbi:DUF4365 domain-containing protein [Lysobacter terrae]
MQYDEKKIIGDIGELTVAKAFIKYFRWPCRQQTTDLGIDAEVEALDDNGASTGKIVKVQVKATMKPFTDGTNTSYPDREHIEYWKNFSVPVLYCYVSLATDEVLWTVIDPNKNYLTDKGAKVELDRAGDALTAHCKKRIRCIAVEGSDLIMQILGLVEKSIAGFFDTNGNCVMDIDNQRSQSQHQQNRQAIQMAYSLFDLFPQQASTAARARVRKLDALWNQLDIEADRQQKADLY